MKLRALKRLRDARTVDRARTWAPDRFDVSYGPVDDWEDHDGEDEYLCADCGLTHDMCECHIGEECGRWRNGVLSSSCSKAGSEECDFECPYGR